MQSECIESNVVCAWKTNWDPRIATTFKLLRDGLYDPTRHGISFQVAHGNTQFTRQQKKKDKLGPRMQHMTPKYLNRMEAA